METITKELTPEQIKKKEYNKKFREKQKKKEILSSPESPISNASGGTNAHNDYDSSEWVENTMVETPAQMAFIPEPELDNNKIVMTREEYDELADFMQYQAKQLEYLRNEMKEKPKAEPEIVDIASTTPSKPSFLEHMGMTAMITTLTAAIPVLVGVTIQNLFLSTSANSANSANTMQTPQSQPVKTSSKSLY